MGRIVAFFKMGRIDAWDELSLFGIWDELSLGTNCRLGGIVAFWNLGRIVAWDELSPNHSLTLATFWLLEADPWAAVTRAGTRE